MRSNLICILCFLALCSAVWAKDKDEYRTGKVVKFESVVSVGDAPSVWSRNVVTIRDGSEQYTAGYVVHVLGHHPKDLAVGQDINYRVSGDKLFLKTTDGKQIKAKMCKKKGQWTECAGMTFASAD